MLVATAGHVDHGKTTLVNALTGVDTDRLPEEKSRGLTIELGFAYLQSPTGTTLGFIDVPGHEKFIRNMASGVGAIDVALLVVAADDGVMPQTREHVAILDLFGIEHCAVAITRSDLVETAQIERVTQQVQQELENTRLETDYYLPVCAPDNTGIEELKNRLFSIASELDERSAQAHFRLAIDRSFSVRGAGTVVTGSVFSGSISEGDTVQILPDQKQARVREVHVNGARATTAKSGDRAALNLASLNHQDATRGNWTTAIQQSVISTCVDVQLRVLDSETRALRHWTPVHVHAGAAATTGRIALYDSRNVQPGKEGYAQLVLDHPQHLLFGDRFILRDQTATRTIGGGKVIDPFASRQKQFRKNRLPQIAALDNTDHHLALHDALDTSPDGIVAEQFGQSRNLPSEAFERILSNCDAHRYADAHGSLRLIAQTAFLSARNDALAGVNLHHQQEPESQGMAFDLLRRGCKLNLVPFAAAIDALLKEKALKRVGDRLQIYGYQPRLDTASQELLNRLLTVIRPDMLKPPALSELARTLETTAPELLQKADTLVKAGYLVKVANNRLYNPEALEQLVIIAQELSAAHAPQGFDAQAFRDRTGIGRNITIDVLEYFDSVGLTRRLADRRICRR